MASFDNNHLTLSDDTMMENLCEDILSCELCHKIFEFPPSSLSAKCLECAHYFCKLCLEALIENMGIFSSITCPTCKEETTVGGAGINSLNDNIAIMRLLFKIKILKSKSIQSVSENSSKCSLCSFDDAEYNCLDCSLDNNKYCSNCYSVHIESLSSFSHRILKLRNSEIISPKSISKFEQTFDQLDNSYDLFLIDENEVKDEPFIDFNEHSSSSTSYNLSPENNSNSVNIPENNLQLQNPIMVNKTVELEDFPPNLIGALIGLEGARIKKIRHESKCKINVIKHPVSPFNPLSSISATIEYSGAPESIALAKSLVQEVKLSKLSEPDKDSNLNDFQLPSFKTTTSTTTTSFQIKSLSLNSNELNIIDQNEISSFNQNPLKINRDTQEILNLRMASEEVGKLMGPKGGRIRSLQKVSGCRAFVYKPLEDNKNLDCCLLLKGPSNKINIAYQLASDILNRQLQKFPDNFNIEEYEGYSRFSNQVLGINDEENVTETKLKSTDKLPFIPEAKKEVTLHLGANEIGRLMGPKGDRLVVLENNTNCRIRVIKPTIFDDKKTHTLEITGNVDSIYNASQLIQSILGRPIYVSDSDKSKNDKISPSFDYEAIEFDSLNVGSKSIDSDDISNNSIGKNNSNSNDSYFSVQDTYSFNSHLHNGNYSPKNNQDGHIIRKMYSFDTDDINHDKINESKTLYTKRANMSQSLEKLPDQDASQIVTSVINCPIEVVGHLIGIKGSNLKRLCKVTGCKVIIEDAIKGKNFRPVILRGQFSAVKEAANSIKTSILEKTGIVTKEEIIMDSTSSKLFQLNLPSIPSKKI